MCSLQVLAVKGWQYSTSLLDVVIVRVLLARRGPDNCCDCCDKRLLGVMSRAGRGCWPGAPGPVGRTFTKLQAGELHQTISHTRTRSPGEKLTTAHIPCAREKEKEGRKMGSWFLSNYSQHYSTRNLRQRENSSDAGQPMQDCCKLSNVQHYWWSLSVVVTMRPWPPLLMRVPPWPHTDRHRTWQRVSGKQNCYPDQQIVRSSQ